MCRSIFLILLCLFLLPQAHASGTEQDSAPSARYSLTIPHGHIKASWQKTGLKDADDSAREKVMKESRDFSARVEELDRALKGMGMETPECELNITAAVSAGGRTIGVLWATYEFLGGNHGSMALESRIYHVFSGKDGKRNFDVLELHDLFRKPAEAVQTFCDYSREELRKRGLDPFMVDSGTAPEKENFSVFLLDDDGLTLFFEPYQVAPWAEGVIKLHVPLSRLKNAQPVLSFWKK